MSEKLYIIDTTSPFFVQHPKTVINWSKVPYYTLEKNGRIKKKLRKHILKDFEKYIKSISDIGYTAISVDDLCHMVSFHFYTDDLNEKIALYKEQFKKIFQIAKNAGLKIFITSDIMFFNKEIDKYTGGKEKKIISLLNDALSKCFQEYPEIDGIIFRIGESDGVDVRGDFLSRLCIKNAKEANRYIRSLIPTFEKYKKLLIFRTWTIGAYKIGDLIWNEKTYEKAFKNIQSESFVLSMKYGEGDFFKYDNLNKLFSKKDGIRKLIELQTRREYEGFGEYPNFVGWDYRKFYEKIKDAPMFSGINVWCQTGGWSETRNFTFLKNTSLWNEFNTYATLKMFKEGLSINECVSNFFGKDKTKKVLHFLKLADEVVSELLYDPEFAKNRIYFNKVKLPPLLHISWHNVTITIPLIMIYTMFTKNKNAAVDAGFHALLKIKMMKKIAKAVDLPYNFRFHYDTFKTFAMCREIIYSKNRYDTMKRVIPRIKKYRKKHPRGYRFHIRVLHDKDSFLLKILFKLALRKKKKYRLIDKLLFNPISAQVYMFIFRHFSKAFPDFVNHQAMGINILLK